MPSHRTEPWSPFLLLSLLGGLAAQGPAPEPTPARVRPYPIDLPPAFVAAITNGTRTTTGAPGPRHWTNTARYDLAIELDPAAARLTGHAKATYVNRSPHALDRLVLHLRQNLLRPEAERTRTVTPGQGFELGEVKVAGRPVRARPTDTRLVLRLPEPLPPGGETVVEIDYALDVPAASSAPRLGHEGDRVFYLGYWYPQFAVFDDVEGWVADRYRGNGEFYMEHADYDLHVTAPVGYLVRATGELQNPAQVLTPRARDALALAAQQREVVHVIDADDHAAGKVTNDSPTGKLTWHFRAERVRDAAVSIARTYLWDATHAVVKDQHGPGQDGTCMIHAVYEANAGDWVRAAEYARHTIEFMSAHLHPYPWPHMTACEGIIGGGMEYPMMTICGGRRPAGVIAHELCHMWFPMLVGSNEKRYAWQDEGFTSFWTTLVRDDFTGTSGGAKRDVLSYANAVRRGDDAVCMRHADTYGDDDFGFATYGKTAAVLHQLRARLGDEVFFAAFRRYTRDWAFKHPYPYDFFRCFATTAGQDLEPYFRTWFYETWRLDHVIQGVVEVDGGTEVTIVDQGRALHPAVVEATFANGQKQRQTVPESTWQVATSATLRFGPGVVEVVIDPDTTSLDSNRDDNRWRRPEPAK